MRKSGGFLAFIFVFSIIFIGHFQSYTQALESEDLKVLQGDGNEMLWEYMHALAGTMPKRDFPPVSAVEWDSKKEEVRANIKKILGIDGLERTPLNARVTGIIEQPEFTIEKVVFESRPGFFVVGNLWKPRGVEGKMPALLWIHGHNEELAKAAYGWPQQSLVRKGIIVFSIDGVGFGEREALNHYTNASCWTVGTSTHGFQIWDNIRAIDYLVSRPDVDPNRLGSAGRSGGGTQTLYMIGVESRLSAAVVMAGQSSMQRAYIRRADGHCICNYTLNTLRYVNTADILSVGAPNVRTLVIQGQLDPLFNFFGSKESYLQAKEVYKLYGNKNGISFFSDMGQHPATQKQIELTVKFLVMALNPSFTDYSIPEYEGFTFDELRVGMPDSLSTVDMCEDTAEKLVKQHNEEIEMFTGDKERLKNDIINEIFGGFPELPSPAVEKIGEIDTTTHTIEKLLIETEPGLELPVLLALPKNAPGPANGLIILNQSGKFLDDAILNQYEGLVIVAPDLRGFGELAPGPDGELKAQRKYLEYELTTSASMAGRPLLGMRVFDVIRIVDYLETRDNINLPGVSLSGSGGTAPIALLTAALDSRVAADTSVAKVSVGNAYPTFFLRNLPPDFSMSYYLTDILKYGDVPHIAAMIAPRKLDITTPETPVEVSLRNADFSFSFTRNAYEVSGATDNFTLVMP